MSNSTLYDRKAAQLGQNQTRGRAEYDQGEEENCKSSGTTCHSSLRSIERVEKDNNEKKKKGL